MSVVRLTFECSRSMRKIAELFKMTGSEVMTGEVNARRKLDTARVLPGGCFRMMATANSDIGCRVASIKGCSGRKSWAVVEPSSSTVLTYEPSNASAA